MDCPDLYHFGQYSLVKIGLNGSGLVKIGLKIEPKNKQKIDQSPIHIVVCIIHLFNKKERNYYGKQEKKRRRQLGS